MTSFDRVFCDYSLPDVGGQARGMTTTQLTASLVEYAVRFAGGRVEWVRRVRLDVPQVGPASAPSMAAMVPEAMGRPVSLEEFRAAAPRRLDLVDGRIPGAEKLVLILLTTMGLKRVAALVGRDAWLAAAKGLDK